ncbi:hypothetical protein [uncultured Stenotrophomonas sp.]|uniref:hypothetical protein n=1 Tax=uncultured Stenotrophomonas sp. TaxID=165438 RepID=UPI0025CDB33C|nr:hypothetical protein [uncultured Stenotrophomonas sp.]
MTDFKHFPNDSRLWFTRWIERFNKPHKSSTSTSVCCYLSPLPASLSDPAKTTPAQIASLFAQDSETFETHILAGALPTYRVGEVFRQARRVGVLPAVDLNLGRAIAQGELSAKYGSDLTLDSVIARSAGYPIKAVPTRQLHLGHRIREGSQVLIVEHQDIEFIIPRALIFRTFYARSSFLASVFTSSAWSTAKHRALLLDKEYAGHRTGRNEEFGTFDVIMQRGMRLDDAHQMALLHFYEYGEAQANALFNPMLKAFQDTKPGKETSWFSNARLPLDPTLGPYQGKVAGYFLTPHTDQRRQLRTFLVTSIAGTSMPHNFKVTRRILVNDGSLDGDVEVTDGPSPYGGKPGSGGRRPNDKPSDDGHNGSTNHQSFDSPGDSFEWIGAPEPVELEKKHSKKYSQPRVPPESPVTEEGSYGDRDGSQGSQSSFEGRLITREALTRFKMLIKAMDAMILDRVISGYEELYADDSTKRVSVGARVCWNFLDQAQRQTAPNQRYRRGWQFVHPIGKRSGGLERAALVLEVTLLDGRTAYWIEVQTRQGAMSPLLICDGSCKQEQISTALNIIAGARGANLEEAFERPKAAYFFTHRYLSGGEGPWDLDWLKKFFSSIT